ncbi:MAG: outer membrane beta-barrel protein [Bacteroidales bacterium]|nr:outer membrane beta-barrel protein [Bacteroidales bacterium]
MKKILASIIFVSVFCSLNAQVIKLQVGTSISKLDWKIPTTNDQLYDMAFTGNSFFLGIDYLKNGNYNLTTNIGYLQKGGKSESELSDPWGIFTGQTIVDKPTLNYLSFNTAIDFNYPLSEQVLPFICGGPRIDFLIGHSDDFSYLEKNDELKKIAYGLLFGAGIKLNISKIQIGLKGDYYLNFSKIAEWNESLLRTAGEITDDTFTLMLSLGYAF